MKRAFLKTLYFIYIRVYRIFKPVTTGVRIMLIRNAEVLLVKHSYMDQWYFPGGAVKKRERLDQAARREALEEVGATVGEVSLLGVYTSFLELRTDHIVVFISQDFNIVPKRDWEIAAAQFFPLDALPDDVAGGIRRRIQDYLNGIQAQNRFGAW